MKDCDVRTVMKRLCSAAVAEDGKYYPESCQRCKSPCKYGTNLLHHYGIARLEAKETPTERVGLMSSRRMRTRVMGYNKRSIIR